MIKAYVFVKFGKDYILSVFV